MKYDKKELQNRVHQEATRFLEWFEKHDAMAIERGPEGAWSAGQHLLHLIKSTKPLAVGLGYPRLLLRIKFGKAKGGSSTYEDLVSKYTAALDRGGKAMGEFVPRKVEVKERELLLNRFRSEVDLLKRNIDKWPEESLDGIAIPHPLIGKLTVREMLYFTIYHTAHHAKILEERYK